MARLPSLRGRSNVDARHPPQRGQIIAFDNCFAQTLLDGAGPGNGTVPGMAPGGCVAHSAFRARAAPSAGAGLHWSMKAVTLSGL